MAELKLVLEHDVRWVFGQEFLIQCALFEKTGYGDWILSLSEGPNHNMTDGEEDYYVEAKRVCSLEFSNKKWKTSHSIFPRFRVNANGYSWQSWLDIARSAVKPLLSEIRSEEEGEKQNG